MSARNRTYRPAAQSTAAARPSSDGGWRVVFPPAVDTHNPRSRETTRVAPFAHLHIGSFANLHIGSFANYSLKFSFSAKERDTETGLSYFGSRYYSSDLSLWLSVDPMSGKYPSLSPYVYCANNPVRCVDPNGEKVVNPYEDAYNDFLAKKDDADKTRISLRGTEGYSEANKAYKEAKKDFKDVEWKYNAVNRELSKVRKYLPELYDLMDNLKDVDGNVVDVIVGLSSEHNVEGWHTCPKKGENSKCPNSVDVYLNTEKAYETNTDLGRVLAHEFGHLSYIVPNWKKYQQFLSTVSDKHNGHENKDKSGENAMKYADEYDRNKLTIN